MDITETNIYETEIFNQTSLCMMSQDLLSVFKNIGYSHKIDLMIL